MSRKFFWQEVSNKVWIGQDWGHAATITKHRKYFFLRVFRFDDPDRCIYTGTAATLTQAKAAADNELARHWQQLTLKLQPPGKQERADIARDPRRMDAPVTSLAIAGDSGVRS